MQWMNQNAGAVQAMMAIVIVLLTGVLVIVTCWYTTLTRDMALTLKEQLAASFQPNIEMTLTNRLQGRGSDERGGQHEDVSGTITVINKGNLPLKVVAVAMKLIYDKNAFPIQTMTRDAKQRVVSPGQTTQFLYLSIDVPLGGSQAPYEQLAQIHCSDLAGVSKHSFSVSSREKDQTNQSIGFQPV
jgi:hypothetical protein